MIDILVVPRKERLTEIIMFANENIMHCEVMCVCVCVCV